MTKALRFFLYLILCLTITDCALATGKPFTPRFVSIKPNEVNVRVGPGQNYPTDWVYLKAGIPVEIIAEFDVWRKIRDIEGTEGWVHQSMLCSKRHAIVQSPEAFLYKTPDPARCPLVRLQKGVFVDLLKCSEEWCQVRIEDIKGWVQRNTLWGVYPKEPIG